MSEWTIRRAEARDLDAIMALETATFVNDAWSRRVMAAELAGAHTYYLVAEEGGDLVGYAGLMAPRGADADVQTLAIATAHRREGIGAALLDALLDEAARRGAHHVFLEVRADNPVAQNLYRSRGFAQIAVRRGYYQPDGVDALVLRAKARQPGPVDGHPGGGAA